MAEESKTCATDGCKQGRVEWTKFCEEHFLKNSKRSHEAMVVVLLNRILTVLEGKK